MQTFTRFWQVDLSIFTIWMSPFIVLGVSGEYFQFYCILHKNSCKQASVDPVQMPHSAASELGLHCFHNTPKRVQSKKG